MLRAALVTDSRAREERCISSSWAIGLVHYKAGYSMPAKCEMIALSTCSSGDARRLIRNNRGDRHEKRADVVVDRLRSAKLSTPFSPNASAAASLHVQMLEMEDSSEEGQQE